MNKNCARCLKVVYPIEELKCLDKIWHKTCFKCTECNMALNMKTYKGFNKNPYCEAHIPKAKATTIAETPELKRIAENTKIQSNAKYHAEFEKSKGKLTQIADDPETLRIKQNTKNISNVAYHGDIQKKAAMERQRELTEIVDNRDNNESEYFSETLAAESLPHYQPAAPEKSTNLSPTNSPYSSVDATNYANNNSNSQHSYSSSSSSPAMSSASAGGGVVPTQQNMINNNAKYQQPPNYNGNGNTIPPSQQMRSNGATNQQMQQQLQQKYYDQYENQSRTNGSNGMSQSTYNSKSYGQMPPPQQQSMTASYNQQMNYNNHYNHHQNGGGGGGGGKITDYDPMTGRQNQTLIYSSDRAAMQAQQQQQQQRRVGSVTDMDPVNGYYGSIAHEQQQYIQQQQQQQQRQYLEQQRLAAAAQQQQQQQQAKSVSKVRVYRALYDYEAQDYDEVSFSEGDLIFEVNSIDGGWMTGRIERTGKIGMLPANYIEQVMI